MATIAVLGTLDSKGKEHAFLADHIRSHGHDVLFIDVRLDLGVAAGADIVVATPGRLIDHFYRTTMRFGAFKCLILDEVDRMLDMGFLPQVRKIVNLCPWEGRQTLFFSAGGFSSGGAGK